MAFGIQGVFQGGRKSHFQVILGGQSFAAGGILGAGAAHPSPWMAWWPWEGFGSHLRRWHCSDPGVAQPCPPRAGMNFPLGRL